MRLILFTVVLCFAAAGAVAQEYNAGVISTPGAAPFKFQTTIVVTDSVFIVKVPGHPENVKKITSKTESAFYVTDGTAVDKVSIYPSPGKLKGFTYTHHVIIDSDKRFDGKKITYYCTKR